MQGGWYRAGVRDYVNFFRYSDQQMCWVRTDGPYSVDEWENMMEEKRAEEAAALTLCYFFLNSNAYRIRLQKQMDRDEAIELEQHVASSKLQASVRGRRDRRITRRLRDDEAERQRLIAIEAERIQKEKDDFAFAVTVLQGRARGLRDRRKTAMLRAETSAARR